MSELKFGVLDMDIISMPLDEKIIAIGEAVNNYCYDEEDPPHFTKLFTYIIKQYSTCTDMDTLMEAADVLSNIAGYKLGMNVRNVASAADTIMLALLSSPGVNHMKAAINFYRRVARVLGPRAIFTNFISQNTSNAQAARGLAIIAHQTISDFPTFPFDDEDFKEWVFPLSSIPSVGPLLVSAIKSKIPGFNDYDKTATRRPPSVPSKINPAQVSGILDRPPLLPPNSARIPSYNRLLPRRSSGEGSIIFQMTEKQQQIREFIDEPFGPKEKPADFVNTSIRGLSSSDWETRTASYNTYRRVLKYAPGSTDDNDLHSFVAAVMEDIESPRAALSLAAVDALQEAFKSKGEDMESELGRLMPVLLKRFNKTAQFFESALSELMLVIVAFTSPKRFISVIVSCGDSRSPKVQVAVAEYLKESLIKAVNMEDKLFRRSSDDLSELIKLLSKLLQSGAKAARDDAKGAAKKLEEIYGENLQSVIQKALEPRASADFLRCL